MTTARDLEVRSSAITLSDMEIFVFPELLYSLLLANMMSPRIWRWRDDPWFDGLEKLKPYRRITRLKQYIMEHYIFNLDLDTWGLTTKARELSRFKSFLSAEMIKQSNALFGYEGDKYYFDLDIRTHFGLDKYDGDVIPYWKTETVEAMDAFRYKEGYRTGAGECVSLSTLYAAALFIIAQIPLRDIYLMATPLHSQNFIDSGDGVLTNNRRLVTKNMWFNGTELSAQARRALENEHVTVVTHESGWIHTIYNETTIDRERYTHFDHQLRAFLKAKLTAEILGNFLRHHRDIQKCFQLRWPIHGIEHYLPLEKAFAFEDGCAYLVTDATRDKLMAEMDAEDFIRSQIEGRIVLNDLEIFIRDNRIDLDRLDHVNQLKTQFACDCMRAELAIEALIRFCRVEPRLPALQNKNLGPAMEPLHITINMDRQAIIQRLEAIRSRNRMADLAFYCYRDLLRTEAEPFLLAAIERNPVCRKGTEALREEELAPLIRGFTDESIYDDDGRLAQPDEVWNYRRGDGVEKAVLLAVLLHHRHPTAKITVEIQSASAIVHSDQLTLVFPSNKHMPPQTWAIANAQR